MNDSNSFCFQYVSNLIQTAVKQCKDVLDHYFVSAPSACHSSLEHLVTRGLMDSIRRTNTLFFFDRRETMFTYISVVFLFNYCNKL